MIRLVFVALLLAACTPAVPAGATPIPTPAPATADPTAQPTTPEPSQTPTTRATSGAPYCDPVYDDCDPRYTPRPETPRPDPNSGTAIGTSRDGTYLVDEEGLSLYTFANDSPGKSECAAGCAEDWPPLPAELPLTQLPGVEGNLSIIQRDDRSEQVAYNDRPLYYYSGDGAPGDTNGRGVSDVWHLATP